MQVPLFRLQCGANSYDWGKKGNDSAVARFAAATPSDGFTVQSDKTYSELWMGSHPSNPSKHLETGRTLLELFSDNQALLSKAVAEKYGSKLPFLFKVLSIDKALSIQAHPDKTLAEQLHARDPKNYPDDNHKPEMVIAVTPFEGLCGFRPLEEIAHFLETVAPLRRLVGDDKAAHFIETARRKGTSGGDGGDNDDGPAKKKALQAAFARLMSSSDQDVAKEVAALVELARTEGSNFAGGGVASTKGEVLAELVTRLHGQYGADIGIPVLFFLNYVTLSPGEALFLVADDIHAYISGDAVECMAASDNVVRCGLTPKYRDMATLVDMLTYNHAPIEEQKMVPAEYPYAILNRAAYSSASSVALYDPPIEEFAVVRANLRGPGAKATFGPLEGPSILICTAGRGTVAVGPTRHEVREGYVFFVGSTAEVVLESAVGEGEEFTTFRAFCEIDTNKSAE